MPTASHSPVSTAGWPVSGTGRGYRLPSLILVALLATLAGCHGRPSTSPESCDCAPASREEAIAAAEKAIGVSSVSGAKYTASVVALPEDLVPFMGASLSGRRAWRIDIHGACFNVDPGETRVANPFLKKITIYLSPMSGQVMMAVSEWPEEVRKIAPYPPAREVERQMRASSHAFTGLPSDPPAVSLDSAIAKGMF